MSYGSARVLVLGATGFIGRQVAEALVTRAGELILSSRNPAGNADVVSCDVMRPPDVADLVRRVQPDITFNLAGYGVDPTERDEKMARRINAELPAQLAVLLSDVKNVSWTGQQLVHAGSALEYGPATGDLRESTACTPTTLYGQSKLVGTIALQHHAQKTGLQAVTARLFTVYGPGEHAGRLLPSLIDTARTGKPLALTDGKQRRDFTFVGDVVEGLLRLGTAPVNPGEVVNLATGKLDSVRSFVERAAQVLGIAQDLLQFGALPTRAEEMSHELVSIKRLRELTGWAPSTSIEEGVRQTADQ